ncbi:collagen alpha-1(I) chain-like [Canis lupus familiaris]|uniref:collagen alpha-1(I) chain-like n=1 Tax=Canis lupus familiaris TaxID=9615 RepID=UPI0018F6E16A|nr:collagen alpha-1(I) chain-like [Canis lupus familiaris]
MGGSVVEFSPATREARVRFPAHAARRPLLAARARLPRARAQATGPEPEPAVLTPGALPSCPAPLPPADLSVLVSRPWPPALAATLHPAARPLPPDVAQPRDALYGHLAAVSFKHGPLPTAKVTASTRSMQPSQHRRQHTQPRGTAPPPRLSPARRVHERRRTSMGITAKGTEHQHQHQHQDYHHHARSSCTSSSSSSTAAAAGRAHRQQASVGMIANRLKSSAVTATTEATISTPARQQQQDRGQRTGKGIAGGGTEGLPGPPTPIAHRVHRYTGAPGDAVTNSAKVRHHHHRRRRRQRRQQQQHEYQRRWPLHPHQPLLPERPHPCHPPPRALLSQSSFVDDPQPSAAQRPPGTSPAAVHRHHGVSQPSGTGTHSPPPPTPTCHVPLLPASRLKPSIYHRPLGPHTHVLHSRPAVPVSHRLLRHTPSVSRPLPHSSPARTGAQVQERRRAGCPAAPEPPQTPCLSGQPHSRPVPAGATRPGPSLHAHTRYSFSHCPARSAPGPPPLSGTLCALLPLTPVGGDAPGRTPSSRAIPHRRGLPAPPPPPIQPEGEARALRELPVLTGSTPEGPRALLFHRRPTVANPASEPRKAHAERGPALCASDGDRRSLDTQQSLGGAGVQALAGRRPGAAVHLQEQRRQETRTRAETGLQALLPSPTGLLHLSPCSLASTAWWSGHRDTPTTAFQPPPARAGAAGAGALLPSPPKPKTTTHGRRHRWRLPGDGREKAPVAPASDPRLRERQLAHPPHTRPPLPRPAAPPCPQRGPPPSSKPHQGASGGPGVGALRAATNLSPGGRGAAGESKHPRRPEAPGLSVALGWGSERRPGLSGLGRSETGSQASVRGRRPRDGRDLQSSHLPASQPARPKGLGRPDGARQASQALGSTGRVASCARAASVSSGPGRTHERASAKRGVRRRSCERKKKGFPDRESNPGRGARAAPGRRPRLRTSASSPSRHRLRRLPQPCPDVPAGRSSAPSRAPPAAARRPTRATPTQPWLLRRHDRPPPPPPASGGRSRRPAAPGPSASARPPRPPPRAARQPGSCPSRERGARGGQPPVRRSRLGWAEPARARAPGRQGRRGRAGGAGGRVDGGQDGPPRSPRASGRTGPGGGTREEKEDKEEKEEKEGPGGRRTFGQRGGGARDQKRACLASPSGNRTPVSRVTGGDTHHYTNEDGGGGRPGARPLSARPPAPGLPACPRPPGPSTSRAPSCQAPATCPGPRPTRPDPPAAASARTAVPRPDSERRAPGPPPPPPRPAARGWRREKTPDTASRAARASRRPRAGDGPRRAAGAAGAAGGRTPAAGCAPREGGGGGGEDRGEGGGASRVSRRAVGLVDRDASPVRPSVRPSVAHPHGRQPAPGSAPGRSQASGGAPRPAVRMAERSKRAAGCGLRAAGWLRPGTRGPGPTQLQRLGPPATGLAPPRPPSPATSRPRLSLLLIPRRPRASATRQVGGTALRGLRLPSSFPPPPPAGQPRAEMPAAPRGPGHAPTEGRASLASSLSQPRPTPPPARPRERGVPTACPFRRPPFIPWSPPPPSPGRPRGVATRRPHHGHTPARRAAEPSARQPETGPPPRSLGLARGGGVGSTPPWWLRGALSARQPCLPGPPPRRKPLRGRGSRTPARSLTAPPASQPAGGRSAQAHLPASPPPQPSRPRRRAAGRAHTPFFGLLAWALLGGPHLRRRHRRRHAHTRTPPPPPPAAPRERTQSELRAPAGPRRRALHGPESHPPMGLRGAPGGKGRSALSCAGHRRPALPGNRARVRLGQAAPPGRTVSGGGPAPGRGRRVSRVRLGASLGPWAPRAGPSPSPSPSPSPRRICTGAEPVLQTAGPPPAPAQRVLTTGRAGTTTSAAGEAVWWPPPPPRDALYGHLAAVSFKHGPLPTAKVTASTRSMQPSQHRRQHTQPRGTAPPPRLSPARRVHERRRTSMGITAKGTEVTSPPRPASTTPAALGPPPTPRTTIPTPAPAPAPAPGLPPPCQKQLYQQQQQQQQQQQRDVPTASRPA